MDYTLYIQEFRRQAADDLYGDFAQYLDMYNGNLPLALHWFNESRKSAADTPITPEQADEFFSRWQGF